VKKVKIRAEMAIQTIMATKFTVWGKIGTKKRVKRASMGFSFMLGLFDCIDLRCSLVLDCRIARVHRSIGLIGLVLSWCSSFHLFGYIIIILIYILISS